MPKEARPLAGRTIAVPETREVDLFVRMLEDEGATTYRCPLVAILDAPDAEPINDWLRRVADGRFDDLILLTGEGLRRLHGFAERAAIWDSVRVGLGNVRTIVRGPKPAKALREMGLAPTLSADAPTTAGVMAMLTKLDLVGRRVGVQLYGQEPNEPLAQFLRDAGAKASFVAPYVYAPKSDDERVVELIDRLANADFDALALTSSPQVNRLLEVADETGRSELLRLGLQRVVVAAIGPVVAARLRENGIEPTITPKRTYFLRPLVTALAKQFGSDA